MNNLLSTPILVGTGVIAVATILALYLALRQPANDPFALAASRLRQKRDEEFTNRNQVLNFGDEQIERREPLIRLPDRPYTVLIGCLQLVRDDGQIVPDACIPLGVWPDGRRTIVVGSNPLETDIAISHSSLSERNTVFEIDKTEKCIVRYFGTPADAPQNIKINGELLEHGSDKIIYPADRITLGDFTFIYQEHHRDQPEDLTEEVPAV